ncbi:hypothetical protein ABZ136_31510, partial [Streptomyces microflavus]
AESITRAPPKCVHGERFGGAQYFRRRETEGRAAPGGTPAGPRCRPPLLGGHPARTRVHGMCGLLAARSALRGEFGRPLPALGRVGAGTLAA